MKELRGIWEKALEGIRPVISEKEYSLWISVLVLGELKDNIALIQAPNKFVAEWVTERYLKTLEKYLNEASGSINQIRVSFESVKKKTSTSRTRDRLFYKKKSFFSNINPSLTFSSFISSKTNKLALTVSVAAASAQGDIYNPLYIFCKHSAGKTHLLNAIGNYIISKNVMARPAYLSAKDFKKNYKSTIPYDQHDLEAFIIDDIEVLGGNKKAQQRLINIFDKLHQGGVQMVFAGKIPPRDIQEMDPRLKSRLEGGLVCEIMNHDMETRLKILKNRASGGNRIPESVMEALAEASNDIKTSIRCLVRLETLCSMGRIPMDFTSAKMIIDEENSKLKATDMEQIIDKICRYFHVSYEELTSKRRNKSISYPRHIAMYLSRTLGGGSYSKIGKFFSNRDKSTISYSVEKIKNEISFKKDTRDDIVNLTRLISGSSTTSESRR